MRLAVLTSGGDAPGMNAAVRICVITALAREHEIFGVHNGYEGLLKGAFVPLGLPDVDNIARMGGTFLGSGRSQVFPTEEGQNQAHKALIAQGIDGLVVIGGNGSLTGAHRLAGRVPRACQIVGLPASIDNDIGHCDLSIGADTAANTIVEACDRILDTARAHRRAFLVEVMGRRSGFLAMRAGISAEADAILYGERNQSREEVLAHAKQVLTRCFVQRSHKNSALIMKAEGVDAPTPWLVEELQAFLNEKVPGVGIRATVLGHLVRGGSPSALDRTIAQRLAYGAIQALEAGQHDVMMAWQPPMPAGTPTMDPYVVIVPLADVLDETHELLNGKSPVIQKRMALLDQVEHLLTF